MFGSDPHMSQFILVGLLLLDLLIPPITRTSFLEGISSSHYYTRRALIVCDMASCVSELWCVTHRHGTWLVPVTSLGGILLSPQLDC